MKKISATEAYQGMNDIDHKVMEYEIYLLTNSDQRKGREMTQQFFLDKTGDIYLEVYWDGEVVQILRFNSKTSSEE